MSFRKSSFAAAAALTMLAVATSGCRKGEDVVAPDNVAAGNENAVAVLTNEIALPVAEPTLGRADLLAAVAGATDRYASANIEKGTDPLVGRAFAIRLPFACGGASNNPVVPVPGLAQATWDREGKTVELRLSPADWAQSAWLRAGESVEAVEGYWVARPWLMGEKCPKAAVDPLQSGGSAPSTQTLGLAALHDEGGSRIGRREGRPYVHTIRPDGETAVRAAPEGYRVLLGGRVAAFADGRATRCRAAGRDERPVCVIAIKLDRVAFEQADGKVLSDWRPG